MTLWLLWSTVWLRHSIGLFVSQIAMPYYCNLNLSHVIGRCCHLSQSNTRDICHIPCLRRKQQLHGPEEVAVVSASLKDEGKSNTGSNSKWTTLSQCWPSISNAVSTVLDQCCPALAQRWSNAGSASPTRFQHWTSVGSMSISGCDRLQVQHCRSSNNQKHQPEATISLCWPAQRKQAGHE